MTREIAAESELPDAVDRTVPPIDFPGVHERYPARPRRRRFEQRQPARLSGDVPHGASLARSRGQEHPPTTRATASGSARSAAASHARAL